MTLRKDEQRRLHDRRSRTMTSDESSSSIIEQVAWIQDTVVRTVVLRGI